MDDDKARGVHALNQRYRRFEQVDKRQRYRLAEAGGGETFDDEYRLRVCDMAQWYAGDRQGFAAELGRALEEIGFAVLVNHGVPQALLDRAERDTRRFFEATPLEARTPYRARRHGSVNQGYFPIKETSRIHPDLVEGWVFCRRAFDLDTDPAYDEAGFWPRPGFRARFQELVRAEQGLILPVMQSILAHLGCDPHLFDQRLKATNFGFRLNYYPPVDPDDAASGAGRMLGHEDVDLFTFLPAPREEGLQLLNRANMKWVRAEAPAGSIILNTGDYLQRICNDRLLSTTHRVSRPRDPATLARPRVSFPLAVYLWEDEVLEVLPGLGPPRYPPIRAVEFHTRITAKYYGDDYAVGPGGS